MTRFEIAMNTNTPFIDLKALAHTLKSEGMEQVPIYHLFSHYHQILDGDDPRYDAVTDVQDLIWGGSWAKGDALFEHEVTADEVA